MPINSGYSFYEYAGDGVTTQFPIQFALGELKRSFVTCRVNNEVDAFGEPLYREIADVPGDPGMVEVLGAVPAIGAPVVFRRIVPKELLLHLYANGSILDYPSLDESHLQLMMALHEVLDGYGLTNVFTDINMNGYKITNVFTDVDNPDSLATVGFLGTYRADALQAAIVAAAAQVGAEAARDAAIAAKDIAVAESAAAQVAAANAASDVSALLSGYVVDAQAAKVGAELAEDDAQIAQLAAEQAALDATAAVSGLDARVDVLESDLPNLATTVADKLDKDENINISVSVAASGASIDFVDIPAGVKRITILLDGVSTNGASSIYMRLGSGALDSTATYVGGSVIMSGTTMAVGTHPAQTYAVLEQTTAARNTTAARYGKIVLERLSALSWSIASRLVNSTLTLSDMYVGNKVLSSALDRLSLLVAGSVFDDGNVSISWEF